MKNNIILVVGCWLMTTLFLAGATGAAVPKLINVQGQLTQNGVPVPGKAVTFSIGNQTIGYKSITTTTPSPVSTQNDGFFSAALDVTSLFPGQLDFSQPYNIQVAYDGQQVSFPMSSVPYAIRAEVADSLVGQENYIVRSGDSMNGPLTAISAVQTGGIGLMGTSVANLGVGVYGVAKKIEGYGVFGRGYGNNTFGGLANYKIFNNQYTYIGVYGAANEPGGVTNIGVYTSSPAGYGLYSEAQKNYFSGNVGIGTMNPAGKLQVSGGNAIFDGNVGVGTTAPGYLLDVAGRMRVRNDANTAGIWFNQGGVDKSFVGVAATDGSKVGLFGNSGAGWGLKMDTTTGNVGIGSDPDTSKVRIETISYTTNTAALSVKASGGNVIGVRSYGDWEGGYFESKGTALHVKSPQLAGMFEGPVNIYGNVNIVGNLSKSSGSFLIDHPLDPKNKVLRHSFVESPDMKNIYDGVVKLDRKGEAVVELPKYFEALNKDFRYQLTAIGAAAPGLFIKEEINNNRFKIAGGNPGQKVSWQVTGIRHDAYAIKHPIVVEEEKGKGSGFERGSYLSPDAFGGKSKAIKAGLK